MQLTDDETRQVREWQAACPYRIVCVARKPGETTIVTAVTTMRLPNKLAREGWTVLRVSRAGATA
jgi:hypothetical protein